MVQIFQVFTICFPLYILLCLNMKAIGPSRNKQSMGWRCIFFLMAWLSTLLIFSCSERQRLNPLDPANPETGGRPFPPNIVSHRDTVILTWEALDFKNVNAINVYRRIHGEPEFTLVATLAPEIQQYTEYEAAYDISRWYRLTVTSGDYESPPSDSVRIRPGPSYVWVANAETGEIIKLTHDGEHIIFRTGAFLHPVKITIDSRNQMLWVADFWARRVIGMDNQGKGTGVELFGPDAVDVEIDTSDNSIWVLNRNSGVLEKFSSSGNSVLKKSGLDHPEAIALDPTDGSVWLLEKGNGQVIQFSRNGDLLRALPGFRFSLDIQIDPVRKAIWVSDSTQIIRLSMENPDDRLYLGSYQYVREIAVNPVTGECWGIDWSSQKNQSKVFKYSPDGKLIFTLTGFSDLFGLSINTYNGFCFVIEARPANLIQLTREGVFVSSKYLGGSLIDVTVENLTD